jgi:predicted secreted protein
VTLATAYDSEIALDGQPHAGWSWEISLDEAVLAEAIRRGPLEL